MTRLTLVATLLVAANPSAPGEDREDLGAGRARVPGLDAPRGRAYTSTFKDATVAIDLPHHAVTASWPNGCRRARGLALDPGRGWVFAGCDEGKAVARRLARRQDPRYREDRRRGGQHRVRPQRSHPYVPAADSATLSVIAVGEHGQLEPLGTLATAPDAHCVAADEQSNVYVCDPTNGRLLVARDPFPP